MPLNAIATGVSAAIRRESGWAVPAAETSAKRRVRADLIPLAMNLRSPQGKPVTAPLKLQRIPSTQLKLYPLQL
jgi:hypothetical protein